MNPTLLGVGLDFCLGLLRGAKASSQQAPSLKGVDVMHSTGAGERTTLALFMCVTVIMLSFVWLGKYDRDNSHEGLPHATSTENRIVLRTESGPTRSDVNTPRAYYGPTGVGEN